MTRDSASKNTLSRWNAERVIHIRKQTWDIIPLSPFSQPRGAYDRYGSKLHWNVRSRSLPRRLLSIIAHAAAHV